MYQDQDAQKSLLEDLQAMLASVPGAPERERLLALLPSARRFDISDEMATSVTDTLNERPHTLEHNLDFLILPDGVCWFEWSERARRTDVDVLMHDVEHPERVGVMIAYANDDTRLVLGTVAWRFPDGRVDHAPAFFSWDEEHLGDLARRARHSYSHVAAESWARMMSMIYTHVPEGYVQEMEVLEDLRDRGPDIDTMAGSARREASAEALFMIGVLLMSQTGRAASEGQGDREILKMIPAGKRLNPIPRPKGFSRRRVRGGTKLEWRPVPES
ncbi:hypothetical protein [Salipiger mucosus]|uniref:Uncharacterized protein n=1 Tax=Salipiger mucosus DSM 16094 TaxID=1123237 RepID=S9S1F6_9RHOB|nr:hypothetical protein [Salipiger mucosus]EPX84035.1 hypothetical protein Salmuc_01810 [Salipiger mucosus DSM 16094]